MNQRESYLQGASMSSDGPTSLAGISAAMQNGHVAGAWAEGFTSASFASAGASGHDSFGRPSTSPFKGANTSGSQSYGVHNNTSRRPDDEEDDDDAAAVEGQMLESMSRSVENMQALMEPSAPKEAESKPKKPRKPTSPVYAYTRDALGTTNLPIARVQRIVKADQEMENVSREAVFLIAAASEVFIKYLSDLAYTNAKLDKRRVVHYRDIQRAIARESTLYFLQDIVPPAMPLSAALSRRQKDLEANLRAEAGVMDGEPDSGSEQGAEGTTSRTTSGGKPKKVKHNGKTWMEKFLKSGADRASSAGSGSTEPAQAAEAAAAAQPEKPQRKAGTFDDDDGDETDDDLPDLATAARDALQAARDDPAPPTTNGRSAPRNKFRTDDDDDTDMEDA